jgi:uncharacterized membrane protein YkvA (DUF1232 family)
LFFVREQKTPDLWRGPVVRAFDRIIKQLFTGLSTDSVDNQLQPSRHASSRRLAMNPPFNSTRYLKLAQRVLARGRLPALLLAVTRKGESGARFARLRGDLKLLQGLCAAWWRGEYRAINSQALLAVVAALVYFLMPLDMVPDWLLGVGLLDDLAVLAWVLRTWDAELQAYRVWREAQTPEVLQRVEALPAAGEGRAE